MINKFPDDLEPIIVKLCENLTYSWNYYFTLNGLHKIAINNLQLLDKFKHFINSIFYSTWESLFVRIHHFTETRRDTISINYLMKIIMKHDINNKKVSEIIKDSQYILDLLKKGQLKHIFIWRNNVIAHLNKNPFYTDEIFLKNNKLHLNDIKNILIQFEAIINSFSYHYFNTINQTRMNKSEIDIHKLFKVLEHYFNNNK